MLIPSALTGMPDRRGLSCRLPTDFKDNGKNCLRKEIQVCSSKPLSPPPLVGAERIFGVGWVTYGMYFKNHVSLD